MRRRKIWLSITVVMTIIIFSAGVGLALKPDNTNELVVAVVSLAVALLALYISLRTFYSIDEVNAISRMDGNVMENSRYRPNILRAVFRFLQIDFRDITETSFFKAVPEKDPQKRTDSLVEDIKALINNN